MIAASSAHAGVAHTPDGNQTAADASPLALCCAEAPRAAGLVVIIARRQQTIRSGVNAADHALRAGDRPASSDGVDLSEGE